VFGAAAWAVTRYGQGRGEVGSARTKPWEEGKDFSGLEAALSTEKFLGPREGRGERSLVGFLLSVGWVVGGLRFNVLVRLKAGKGEPGGNELMSHTCVNAEPVLGAAMRA